jgi:hypothetical protein
MPRAWLGRQLVFRHGLRGDPRHNRTKKRRAIGDGRHCFVSRQVRGDQLLIEFVHRLRAGTPRAAIRVRQGRPRHGIHRHRRLGRRWQQTKPARYSCGIPGPQPPSSSITCSIPSMRHAAPRESLGTARLAFAREGAEHSVLAEPAPKHPRLIDHRHTVVIGGGKHGIESTVEGRSRLHGVGEFGQVSRGERG